MKRICQFFLLLTIAFISFKCQKELSGGSNNLPLSNKESAPITASLQGNVIDENSQPAAGVKISVGSKTTFTNEKGYFRITDASLDKNASILTAERSGYFKAFRSFKATNGVNQVAIKLIKKTLTGTVDATSGGAISLPNGAKVLLSANGITKAGSPYSGAVRVYTAYIDPVANDIGKIVPGSMMADDKDNRRVVLSSYGMLAVELESASGEKLQVATNSTATLTVPIPPSMVFKAPARISLWYVDEQTGIWKEQGTANKNGDNYIGDVKHFSYWNCDISLPAVSFSATIQTSGGAPLKNVSVTVSVAGNGTDSSLGGIAHGYSDSLGQVAGLIASNQKLVLSIMDECYNVVYKEYIGPFSQNTDLGIITVPNTSSQFTTVKGKLLSCDNKPVSNGFAMLYWNNKIDYLRADEQGNFSTVILTCSGASPIFQILGVDETTQQQSSLLTIASAPGISDAGNIIACGTLVAQFLNYTIDGVPFSIPVDADSILSYTQSGLAESFDTYVQGSSRPDNQLNFSFSGSKEAGSYPVNALTANSYYGVGLKRPFNVTITSFPQMQGEFYEGSFSGSFIDSSAVSVLHNIDCSFRIRRRF